MSWTRLLKICPLHAQCKCSQYEHLFNVVAARSLNHRWVLDDLKCFGYPLYAVWAVGNYCMDAVARFSLIKCPTLILWGIDDVKEFERLGLALAKDRYFLSQAIPHGKVVEFSTGTICMINQIPEEIAKAVLEFLDSV